MNIFLYFFYHINAYNTMFEFFHLNDSKEVSIVKNWESCKFTRFKSDPIQKELFGNED